MEFVAAALLYKSFEEIPEDIRDKIAFEILLNSYEDKIKKSTSKRNEYINLQELNIKPEDTSIKMFGILNDIKILILEIKESRKLILGFASKMGVSDSIIVKIEREHIFDFRKLLIFS